MQALFVVLGLGVGCWVLVAAVGCSGAGKSETPASTTNGGASGGGTSAAEGAALTPRATLIPAGEAAPDFTALDQQGKPVELKALLKEHAVVLVFYPADFTPGCTKQLCRVRDEWAEFQKRRAAVLGINPADVAKHADFAAKYEFPFPVLSDEGSRIAAAYGCKGVASTQRTVYVVGRDGKVALSESGMVPHEKIFAAMDGE